MEPKNRTILKLRYGTRTGRHPTFVYLYQPPLARGGKLGNGAFELQFAGVGEQLPTVGRKVRAVEMGGATATSESSNSRTRLRSTCGSP